MQTLDVILFSLYTVGICCALYIVHAHWAYFEDRYRAGVLNLFMVAVLFFLLSYSLKMIDIYYALIVHVFDLASWHRVFQMYLWTIAHIGTTFALIILAILTYTKKYDWFIYFKRADQKVIIKEGDVSGVEFTAEQESEETRGT